jgi:hypothetical protein
MFFKITFWTKLSLASITNSGFVLYYFYYSITLFFRTKFKCLIICSHIEVMYFNVFLLCNIWKVFIKVCLLAHNYVTLLIRTRNLLKHFYFIQNILIQTTRAKNMLAIAQIYLLFFFHFRKTYSTYKYLFFYFRGYNSTKLTFFYF